VTAAILLDRVAARLRREDWEDLFVLFGGVEGKTSQNGMGGWNEWVVLWMLVDVGRPRGHQVARK